LIGFSGLYPSKTTKTHKPNSKGTTTNNIITMSVEEYIPGHKIIQNYPTRAEKKESIYILFKLTLSSSNI